VTDLREALGIVDLPFIAGQIQNVPLVNEHVDARPALCGSHAKGARVDGEEVELLDDLGAGRQ